MKSSDVPTHKASGEQRIRARPRSEAVPPRSPPRPPWGEGEFMPVPLTTRIPIRDSHGNVVDEKEVATYAGLLARAHDEGLKDVTTALVQAPTEENGRMAICFAKV